VDSDRTRWGATGSYGEGQEATDGDVNRWERDRCGVKGGGGQ